MTKKWQSLGTTLSSWDWELECLLFLTYCQKYTKNDQNEKMPVFQGLCSVNESPGEDYWWPACGRCVLFRAFPAVEIQTMSLEQDGIEQHLFCGCNWCLLLMLHGEHLISVLTDCLQFRVSYRCEFQFPTTLQMCEPSHCPWLLSRMNGHPVHIASLCTENWTR